MTDPIKYPEMLPVRLENKDGIGLYIHGIMPDGSENMVMDFNVEMRIRGWGGLTGNGAGGRGFDHAKAVEIQKMWCNEIIKRYNAAAPPITIEAPLGVTKAEAVPRATADKLAEALRYLLEMSDDIPDSNCSCHIHPPCNDCVNYSGIREATQEAQEALNEYNAAKGEQK